jgi:hypothetical protein
MMIPLIAYMAHPLADFEGTTRAEHIARAKRWMQWLTETFEVAITANWILIAEFWPESDEHRTRGLEFDTLHATSANLMFLVGGRVSGGMSIEKAAVEEAGGVILDLTAFGAEPPTDEMLDSEARVMLGAMKQTLREAAAGDA